MQKKAKHDIQLTVHVNNSSQPQLGFYQIWASFWSAVIQSVTNCCLSLTAAVEAVVLYNVASLRHFLYNVAGLRH